jgi:hypothetical protein
MEASIPGVTAPYRLCSSQQKAGAEWVIFPENELMVSREVRASLDLRHHGGDAGDLRLPDHMSPEARPDDAGVV